jgi:hypothetical protein
MYISPYEFGEIALIDTCLHEKKRAMWQQKQYAPLPSAITFCEPKLPEKSMINSRGTHISSLPTH